MTSAQVLHWLRAHADPEYSAFAAALLPGVSDVLGVRLPALRALARKLATEGAQETLNALPATPFEARMLHGLVIGYAKVDFAQRWTWIESFLPLIDNWSVCDSFCVTLAAQWSDAERTVAWPRVRDCSQSESPFVVRFGVVMMIDAYMRPESVDGVLSALTSVRCDAYYARMAVAWALTTALGDFPIQTRRFLEAQEIDPWVRRKAAQKAAESRCVSHEDKQWARTWAKG